MRLPIIKGRMTNIIDPNALRGKDEVKWYINDHCIFVDRNDTLHWFGIMNPYPGDNGYYGQNTHRHIGHAIAKHPFGPWEMCPHAISLRAEQQGNIGACFVVEHKDDIYMLYDSSIGTKGLHLATSRDLANWKTDESVTPVDAYGCSRDPFIMQYGGTYHLFTADTGGGMGVISHLISDDFKHWDLEEPALVSDVPTGALESPCIYRCENMFYLFVNFSHRQYEETLVFGSNSIYRFDWDKPLCTVFGHASEIFEWKGKSYITHCGIEDRHWDDIQAPYGLYLAELQFL